MKILKKIYNDIINLSPHAPPEIGGIIGGNSNVISVYEFDIIKNKDDNYCSYRPHTENLNRIISDWDSRGIEFYGIFHTHALMNGNLSSQDMVYIKQILLSMPNDITFLYFPLVLPPINIVSYISQKNNNDIIIKKEDTVIVY